MVKMRGGLAACSGAPRTAPGSAPVASKKQAGKQPHFFFRPRRKVRNKNQTTAILVARAKKGVIHLRNTPAASVVEIP